MPDDRGESLVDDPGWPSDDDLALLERISEEMPPEPLTDEEYAELVRRCEAAARYREDQGLICGPARDPDSPT